MLLCENALNIKKCFLKAPGFSYYDYCKFVLAITRLIWYIPPVLQVCCPSNSVRSCRSKIIVYEPKGKGSQVLTPILKIQDHQDSVTLLPATTKNNIINHLC